MKAVGLLSGGLDSTLAIKLIKEQGIDVVALNFVSPFCTCKQKGCKGDIKNISQNLGVEFKLISTADKFLKILKGPKYGYGKNMNPCLDCRILIYKKAKKFMKEIGAEFIISGEVLGQRPMSQHRRAIDIIERDSGLKGRILRPLSARLFAPTKAEAKGIIDRNKLLNISGRQRNVQLKLAKDLKIECFACPSGGCLLTDKIFSKKVKDLLEHKQINMENVKLLRIGRHFRINKSAKLIIGRNEKENLALSAAAKPNDMLFICEEVPGPTAIARGSLNKDEILACAAMVGAYADKTGNGQINISLKKNSAHKNICVAPLPAAELDKYRIN